MTEKSSCLVFDSQLENPIVTIGIPAYKGGSLLSEAIESALSQDFDKPFEILVVNDNPKGDDISQLMSEYQAHNSVAYYINNVNLGPTGNWNAMYYHAKGKYVVMLQDDDMLFPCYLRVMFRLMEETAYRYDLIYPQHFVTRNRKLTIPYPPDRIRYRIMKLNDYLVTQWGLPTGLMIEKKKYYESGGYQDELFPINDQEFIYRALHYMRGCQIQLPLALYYIGENLSLKPDILIQGIIQSRKFNIMMRKDKKNIWRYFAPLCLRQQITNQENWSKRFLQGQISIEGRKKIGINHNMIKDWLSRNICNLFKVYIHTVRFKSFDYNNGHKIR